MDDSNEDYEVGYGKPPKEHQFQKDRSGNPRGRPKGAKSFKTLWDEKFRGATEISTAGKRKRVNNKKLLVEVAFAAALKGDFKLAEKLGGLREVNDVEPFYPPIITLKLEEDPSDLDAEDKWAN